FVGRQRLYKVLLVVVAAVVAVNSLCASVHELFAVRFVDGKRCERFSPAHVEMAYYQPKRCFSREDVQQIMVDLVGNLTDLLQQHEIPYWLHGGTLLGSYRHKTVIPHDVDADIGIDQKGYEALRDGKFAFSHDFDLQVFMGKYHQRGTRTAGIPARFIHQKSGFYTNIYVFVDENGSGLDEANAKNNTEVEATTTPEAQPKPSPPSSLFGPSHSARFASCVHCPKQTNGWEFKIPKDWVFPLRPCDFGSTIAMCPARTEQYL
ncbi:hypothetical protein Gpo141_00014975, partial [Globisporangium polare]